MQTVTQQQTVGVKGESVPWLEELKRPVSDRGTFTYDNHYNNFA